VFEAGDVVAELHQAIAPHGHPERMLIDKGAVSAGRPRGHGWVTLEPADCTTSARAPLERHTTIRRQPLSDSDVSKIVSLTCSSRWRV